jgi:hypothetical protein
MCDAQGEEIGFIFTIPVNQGFADEVLLETRITFVAVDENGQKIPIETRTG